MAEEESRRRLPVYSPVAAQHAVRVGAARAGNRYLRLLMHGPKRGIFPSEPDLSNIFSKDIPEYHGSRVVLPAKEKKRRLYRKIIAGTHIAPDVDEKFETLLADCRVGLIDRACSIIRKISLWSSASNPEKNR